jgi:RNA polymerase sigma-70 factor (ECF subfamily)
MSSEGHEEQIVQQIAGCQDRLFAYILTLVPHRDLARDILQETNLVLWRRRAEFVAGTSFSAWASKVAFFQVLAYRRDRGRDRHVFFSEKVLALLADEVQEDLDSLADRRGALQKCLGKLTERQRWLIAQRYSSENSIQVIAEITGQTASAVATAVYRVRNALRNCVTRTLATEGSS